MPKYVRRRGIAGKQSFERDIERMRAAISNYGGTGGGTDHGSLTGLSDDDHSQYGHLSQDEDVLGQWNFAPGVPQPPFTLNTNAQQQAVVGFRADELSKAVYSSGLGLSGGGVLTTDQTITLTSSSNPGTNAAILASADTGSLQLVELIIRAGASPVLQVGVSGAHYLVVSHTGTESYLSTTLFSGDDIRLVPDGDVVLDPATNYVLPYTNYEINLGQINKKFLTLHAAELWVETLVAQYTIATIGGRVLVGPTTELTDDVISTDTTIDVKHNQMAVNDIVYLEGLDSGGSQRIEFMQVTAGPTGTGPYTYTVTRNLDLTGANDWDAGSAVFNTGYTGDGFIDLYALNGVKGGSTAGPTIVGNVRTSTTYNAWIEHWAIGNLGGIYGQSAGTYGVGLGRYATGYNHILITDTVGLQFRNDTNKTIVEIDTSGNATFGQVATNYGNMKWDMTTKQLQFRGGTSGTVVQAYISTAGRFVAGAGDVIMDADGFRINTGDTGSNAVEWYQNATAKTNYAGSLGIDGDFTNGYITADLLASNPITHSGSFANLQLRASNVDTTLSPGIQIVAAEASDTGSITLIVTSGASSRSHTMTWSTFTITGSDLTLSSGDINVTGGYIKVGAATTPSNGQIRTVGNIISEADILALSGLSVGGVWSTTPANGVAVIDNKVFINSSTNGQLTYGLTINQSGADNEILSLKDSTDVYHAMTSVTDPETFGTFLKAGPTSGGLKIRGISDGGMQNLVLQGLGPTDNTTKSSAATGYIHIEAHKDNGSGGTTSIGSNSNALVVRNYTSTSMILDAEGELHLDQDSTGTSGSPSIYDEYDDVMLLTGLRASLMSPEHEFQRRFSEWIEEAKPILQQTGVVTYNDDGHHFIAMKKLNMLMIDGIRQLYDRIDRLERLLEAGHE